MSLREASKYDHTIHLTDAELNALIYTFKNVSLDSPEGKELAYFYIYLRKTRGDRIESE